MPRKAGRCLEGATQGKYITTRKGEKKKKTKTGKEDAGSKKEERGVNLTFPLKPNVEQGTRCLQQQKAPSA